MTIVPFTPNNQTSPPFQATVTLDGNSYSLVTMWNFFAQGWYVALYDQSNNLIMNMPLVGSPPTQNIPLFPGMFQTSTILYRVVSSSFEVTP